MTLHEAIKLVLNEYQRPMTTRELADEINKRNLYQRGDGGPVPTSQIGARVNNYQSLFRKDHLGRIQLLSEANSVSQFKSIINEPEAYYQIRPQKLKLHEAIEQILSEHNRPLTATEIAEKINKRNLYQRGDGNPVPTSQIHARVKNYTSLFIKTENKIGLLKFKIPLSDNNGDANSFEEILIALNNKLNINFALTDLDRLLFIAELVIIVTITKKTSNPKDILSSDYLLSLIKKLNSTEGYKDFFSILLENEDVLDSDFLKYLEHPFLQRILELTKDEIFTTTHSFLLNSSYFDITTSAHFVTPSFINQLLVSIVKPQENDTIYDPALGRGETLLQANEMRGNLFLFGQEIDTKMGAYSRLNLLLSNCENFDVSVSNSILEPSIKKNDADIIISNPPFGSRFKETLPLDFNRVCNDNSLDVVFFEMMLSRLNPVSGRMAIVVSESFLSKGSNLKLRQAIVDSNQLEAVITIPNGAFFPYTGISTSILLINNNKHELKDGTVLFLDGKDSVEFKISNREIEVDSILLNQFVEEVKSIIDLNNSGESIVKHSIVLNNTIADHGYKLGPTEYTSETLELIDEISKNENLISLGDLLTRTPSVPASEINAIFPQVQIKDLNENENEFYLKVSNLIFEDDINPKYQIITESSLLLAKVGNKLKPTYFEYTNQAIAIIPNILAYTVKTKLINKEYLISQLNSPLTKAQLNESRSGLTIPFQTINALMEIKIPVPSLSEQFNRLANYKEQQENKSRLTRFIKDINLVSSTEEIKEEIERFSKSIFKDSEHIEFKREFEYDNFPFSEKEISEANVVKRSDDGLYNYLLLVDNKKRINGVLTIQTENQIEIGEYSEINAYANFIIQTSFKYIKQNTNKLLNDFSHTTKNILKDINKLLRDFVNTKNEGLIKALNQFYVKDEELIEDFIKNEGKKKEDYLAINRLKSAYSIVNKHFELFKRRHTYYTNSVNSSFEEIKLSEFIDRVNFKRNGIELIENADLNDILYIKSVPLELSFTDLIDNSIRHSSDESARIEINSKPHYIEFKIANTTKSNLSQDNYNRLGKEEIKKDDGTFSTGLSNAFRSIKEENEISLAPYEYYKANEKFELTIRLKKK